MMRRGAIVTLTLLGVGLGFLALTAGDASEAVRAAGEVTAASPPPPTPLARGGATTPALERRAPSGARAATPRARPEDAPGVAALDAALGRLGMVLDLEQRNAALHAEGASDLRFDEQELSEVMAALDAYAESLAALRDEVIERGGLDERALAEAMATRQRTHLAGLGSRALFWIAGRGLAGPHGAPGDGALRLAERGERGAPSEER